MNQPISLSYRWKVPLINNFLLFFFFHPLNPGLEHAVRLTEPATQVVTLHSIHCIMALKLNMLNEVQNLTAKIFFKLSSRLQVPLRRPQSQCPGARQVGYPSSKMNI